MSARSAEEQLVSRCVRGEREAQHALYHRYCNAMYATSLRITGNTEHAADALQEAFIEVFRDLESFRFRSTLGAWIKTIVVRKALRHVSSVAPAVEEEMPEQAHIVWPDDLSGEVLHQAILSLPEGFRTVFNLVEVEGFKHAEVAEMLGISESTSKSQLSRAKLKLRSQLKTIYQL